MTFSCRVIIIIWILFSPTLSSAEVKKPGIFKIVYAQSWAPISNGPAETVTGILPNLMDVIIQDRMGITVQRQGLPWARAQQAVKTGDADAFITTPTSTRLEFTRRSLGVVFPVRYQPIVRAGSEEEQILQDEEDITDRLSSKRYCDVLGNGWAKKFYADLQISYDETPTLDICLKHLIEGRTDIIIHATNVTKSFITKMGIANKVKILPVIMSSSPQFPLLLSKNSAFGQQFLKEFDEVLLKIKKEGLWENLVNPSVATTN